MAMVLVFSDELPVFGGGGSVAEGNSNLQVAVFSPSLLLSPVKGERVHRCAINLSGFDIPWLFTPIFGGTK
jgi:hypothetical protein